MGVTRALRTKRESYKGKGERRGVCSNIYIHTHTQNTPCDPSKYKTWNQFLAPHQIFK